MPGSEGFIVINRKIRKWRWWGNPTAMAIWLYILVEANWTTGWWGGGSEAVQRGEFITSQLRMAEELQINYRTLHRYLKMFEDDGQIALEVTNKRTKISVINYAKYQDYNPGGAELTTQLTAIPSTQQSAEPTTNNRTRITKEQRNNNRESFVKPTLDELRAYIFENGFSVDPERFLDYYDSNGWKVGKSRMKDWKKAVNNWQRNEKPKKDGMDYPKEGNGYLW